MTTQAEEYISDVLVCDMCSDRTKCEARQYEESWIYSDQFAYCLDLTLPSYQDSDWWILRACNEGVDVDKPLTDEELMLLAREVDE